MIALWSVLLLVILIGIFVPVAVLDKWLKGWLGDTDRRGPNSPPSSLRGDRRHRRVLRTAGARAVPGRRVRCARVSAARCGRAALL